MLASNNIFVILLHILALLLAVAASYGFGVKYDMRRGRWHLGWLSLAVLILINLLADLGALK